MKTMSNTATATRSSFASAAGGFVSTPARTNDAQKAGPSRKVVPGQDSASVR